MNNLKSKIASATTVIAAAATVASFTGAGAATGATKNVTSTATSNTVVGTNADTLPVPKRSGIRAESMEGVGTPTGHTVINIVNSYTPAAAAAVGGDRKMLDISSQSVANANNALALNRVPVELRLVSTIKTSGGLPGQSSSTVLGDLQNSSSSNYKEARAERARLKAHSLMLFTGDLEGNVAGKGFLNDQFDPRYSMFIVKASSQIDRESQIYSHELGHTLGLHHDSFVEPSAANLINKGFVLPSKGIRDIMSYSNACDAANKICDVAPFFSDPSRQENGSPVGSSNTDAASYLRKNYANYAKLGTNQNLASVESSSPGVGSIRNSIYTSPSVTFSKPVINAQSRVWLETASGRRVPATASYVSRTRTVYLDPIQPLAYGGYRIVVDGVVTTNERIARQTVPFGVGATNSFIKGYASAGTRPTINIEMTKFITNQYTSFRLISPSGEKLAFNVNGALSTGSMTKHNIMPRTNLVKGQTYRVEITNPVNDGQDWTPGTGGSFSFTVK